MNGRAIIAHLVTRIATAFPISNVIVATSALESDDPLAAYGEKLGVVVFRGPLDDVFRRFQLCLRAFPCEWVFRVSADSPLFDATLIPLMSAHADRAGIDLVTNVFPRTFPRGHSLEMIRSSTLLGIDAGRLTPYQREHVTPVFYDNPKTYRIVNIESGDPRRAQINLSVNTVEDLQRIEALARRTPSG
jgi:spore coat polysaccharide biosynthesis protein SpsF (cytidylyltransferase family)